MSQTRIVFELHSTTLSKLTVNSTSSLISTSSVKFVSCSIIDSTIRSAGQCGFASRFLNNTSAPEHASPKSLGNALFDNESSQDWDSMFRVNSASIFFMTTAFLGLLAAGSTPNWPASVINITSVSGQLKIAQNHASALPYPSICPYMYIFTSLVPRSLPTTRAKQRHRTFHACSQPSSRSRALTYT